MADYSRVVSLSQVPTVDVNSSEHTLMRVPTFSISEGGDGDHSRPNPAMHHQQRLITPLTSKNPDRKPRGRPPGSKNKPKPPLLITRDSDSIPNTAFLVIDAGCDIIENIVSFAQKNHVGVMMVSVSGSVLDVTLRNHAYQDLPLSLQGSIELLSLTGSFIPSIQGPQSSPSGSFRAAVLPAQGQMFKGTVVGKLVAETEVSVVVATFVNPSFHRLSIKAADNETHQETMPVSIHGNNGGSIHGNNGGGGGSMGGATEPCSFSDMSMPTYGVAVPGPLNYQPSPDVMNWGPPPPPPCRY